MYFDIFKKYIHFNNNNISELIITNNKISTEKKLKLIINLDLTYLYNLINIIK